MWSLFPTVPLEFTDERYHRVMSSGRGHQFPNGHHEAVDVTALLQLASTGDEAASEQLIGVVYEQLRATAGSYFRDQAASHTLQPTALVHEAHLKLMGNPHKHWESRGHFCAVASTAMRHILRDHTRAKRAARRGGDKRRESLTMIETPSGTSPVDLLELDAVLSALAEFDERGARRRDAILRGDEPGADRPRARRVAAHRRAGLAPLSGLDPSRDGRRGFVVRDSTWR